MAVYKVESGELVKVDEEIEDLVRPEWKDWEDFEEGFLRENLGFLRYDEESSVYRLYRRHNISDHPAELPGVRYIFDVNIDESNIDYILVQDSLPQFLAVMRMLEPLVNRQRRLDQELAEGDFMGQGGR